MRLLAGLKVERYISPEQVTSELRGVTVTCHTVRDHFTECYLPPDTSEYTPPFPHVSPRFTYPGGMEG